MVRACEMNERQVLGSGEQALNVGYWVVRALPDPKSVQLAAPRFPVDQLASTLKLAS